MDELSEPQHGDLELLGRCGSQLGVGVVGQSSSRHGQKLVGRATRGTHDVNETEAGLVVAVGLCQSTLNRLGAIHP